MATKWKSSFIIIFTAFLFTFGLSGILSFFIYGSQFFHRDYFLTSEFQMELDEFKGYLSTFELYNMPIEEAKKEIKVSKDEIVEHRYRYGNLTDQINNIKAQYEEKIQAATGEGYQEDADTFKAEMDAKIEDITKNFESDEYVEPKVLKEKEKRLEDYYKKRENYRSEYLRYKGAFHYYVKNIETGKVYTNLKNTDEDAIQKNFSKNNTLFVTNTTVTRDDATLFIQENGEPLNSFIPATEGAFEGEIAVPASLSPSNFIVRAYEKYKRNQMLLLIYVLVGITSLIISIFVTKKSKTIPEVIEKWRPYYNKLPLDIRAIFFILAAFGFIISILGVCNQLIYVVDSPTNAMESCIVLATATVLWMLTLFQGKNILLEAKDWSNVKKQGEKVVLILAFKRMKVLFQKSRNGLTEAFLNQSMGTQLFILLAIVFGLGLASILLIIHPIFILFYIALLAFIGIPLVMILVNKIGYFNRIVEKTDELAAGKLGENLPVTGKSVLAELADNINLLKQGVKTSQNEQVKSERLKTELITNVSHDLRTPLTSIITYTELLKTADVSSDERKAYLEIIDRKSKRLKVLIDDLFEVSKMASGNIELKKEKVDLVQLLQQALGEYDDTINSSHLQFRVTKPERPVYAIVDGQKLWRVFDNLIGNILKYSLEHSRVFITVSKENSQCMITFKNVSKYELNENSDELFERFKRGDTSRHTEGSGLGLAIAQSIVELHDGRLEIETDGDLFKVKISLHLVD